MFEIVVGTIMILVFLGLIIIFGKIILDICLIPIMLVFNILKVLFIPLKFILSLIFSIIFFPFKLIGKLFKSKNRNADQDTPANNQL